MKKPDDVKSLEEKIKKFKSSNADHNKASDEVIKSGYSRSAIGFQASTELLGGVLTGVAIGYLLDRVFTTHPWFTLVFTLLGGAGGLLSVYRTIKAEEKNRE